MELHPPIGTRVRCFFGSHCYTGTVIAYGRKHPKVRFTLKNGRVVEGRATIIPAGAPTGRTYTGYLCQTFFPGQGEKS